MSTQVQKSEFQILDKADEDQILKAQDKVKQALCYELKVGDKKIKQITFIGLKWLALKMSQTGQALEIQTSNVQLEKDDPDKQDFWFWRANVKVRNQKTGLETEGIAECPYLQSVKGSKTYDTFGRTKAHSKAERNAWRKQIPELEITTLLETVTKSDTHDLGSTQESVHGEICKCPFDQMNHLDGKCTNCGKPMTLGQINAKAKSS